MSFENYDIPKNLSALRACKLCKLIKNYDQVSFVFKRDINFQFLHNGCENCESIFHMTGDEERVRDLTSPYFDGFLFFSTNSYLEWSLYQIKNIVGLLLGFKRVSVFLFELIVLEDLIPGIYAINVTGKLPQYMIEDLQHQGIAVPENFEN